MEDRLVITVALTSGRFHGRGQGDTPEWPPSPFRLYQALVAGAAHTTSVDEARSTLQWLELQQTASILTPSYYQGRKVETFVLTNQRDKAIGTAKTEAELKSKKIIKPVILSSQNNCEIHYIFSLDAPDNHFKVLEQITRGVSHFGQGVDSAEVSIANLSQDKIQALSGEEWMNSDAQGTSLSVPYQGALEALERSYSSWREQASRAHEKLSLPPIPVPRLASQKFRHEIFPDLPAFKLFELRNEDGSRVTLPDSYNSRLAGMIRHLTTDPNFASLLGWPENEMAMLHGHAEARGEKPIVAEERFGFVGLPTLRWAGKRTGWRVDDCRRVILTAPAEYSHRLDELTLKINHAELQPIGDEPPIRLVLVPSDSTIKHYTHSASRWSTVTPMILPNQLGSSKDRRRLRDPQLSHEIWCSIQAKLDRRVDTMIRNSIVNAGLSHALAQAANIRWNRRGFWPGATRAIEHTVTKHQKDRPRRHVEIEWFTPSGGSLKIGGPIVLGAGAHAGLGLFAPIPDELEQQKDHRNTPTT